MKKAKRTIYRWKSETVVPASKAIYRGWEIDHKAPTLRQKVSKALATANNETGAFRSK